MARSRNAARREKAPRASERPSADAVRQRAARRGSGRNGPRAGRQTIDLCLSVFDWAPFRPAKAAIKLHTLLDLRGPIPTFIHVSDGKKPFYGTSWNAVKTQIGCAVCVYVRVAMVRKELQLDVSLYTLLQILSVTVFEKTSLQQAWSGVGETTDITDFRNQMNRFDIWPDTTDVAGSI